MQLTQGVKRLAHMAGVESLARNLQHEDEAVRRNIERCEAELLDGELVGGSSPEDDAMRIMAARDVHVYQPAPSNSSVAGTPAAGTATANGPAVPAAQATPATPSMAAPDTSLWKKAATLAAIMAGMGGSAGLGTWVASQAASQPPAAVQSAEPIDVPGYGVEVEKVPAVQATP